MSELIVDLFVSLDGFASGANEATSPHEIPACERLLVLPGVDLPALAPLVLGQSRRRVVYPGCQEADS